MRRLRAVCLSRSLFSLLLLSLPLSLDAVKCYDCVGSDCMGNFCEGDYCLMSYYAPRWGSHRWGEPQVVKGCLSGKMLEDNIRDHCEVSEDDAKDIFTCFCNSRDNCNGGRKLGQLPREPVELITCECDGEHCSGGTTCVGELCSYVINHKTKQVEKGCVNASVPLVERRSVGSCMIPPITGAMHHSVAKEAKDLIYTESCICASDYCNEKKPKIKVADSQKCSAFVEMQYMGNKMASKNISCKGEYCFRAVIKSEIGLMTEYTTEGCASFMPGAELAEELKPMGCAKFESEKLKVDGCYKTKDKTAIQRARHNMQAKKKLSGRRPPPRGRRPKEDEMEIDYSDESEDDAVEEKEGNKDENEESGKEIKQEEDKQRKDEEEEDEEDFEEGEEGKKEGEETSTAKFLFIQPTEPDIPDESNATMITVFVLLILVIAVAGIIYKFQLHKRFSRANYDTVAGG